jgi:hypothetical protein
MVSGFSGFSFKILHRKAAGFNLRKGFYKFAPISDLSGL